MRNIYQFTGALIIFVLGQSSAWAQLTAPIRYNEGPGVKVSEGLVFHPGLAVEGRYDSNPLNKDSSTNIQSAPYLRFIGHLDLATLSPQRLTDVDGNVATPPISFRLRSALAFREYLSSNDNIKAQRGFETDTGLIFALFPLGIVSFELGDDFLRSVLPRYMETDQVISQDVNRAFANFKILPQRRLNFTLGYALTLFYPEESEFAYARNYNNEIVFNGQYKILPKTAFTLDVRQGFIHYYDQNNNATNGLNITRIDSNPTRAYFGLVGLVTTQMSTILKIGYGNGGYSSGDSYSGVLGNAELAFQFGPFVKFKFGYEHNFQDSPYYGSYFSYESIYLGYDHFVLNRVLLHGKANYRYEKFEGIPNIPEKLRANDFILDLGIDYQIKEWVYVGVGYDLTVYDRNVATFNDPSHALAPNFTKHQVFGKIGLSY
jgi:hypothetical protein